VSDLHYIADDLGFKRSAGLYADRINEGWLEDELAVEEAAEITRQHGEFERYLRENGIE